MKAFDSSRCSICGTKQRGESLDAFQTSEPEEGKSPVFFACDEDSAPFIGKDKNGDPKRRNCGGEAMAGDETAGRAPATLLGPATAGEWEKTPAYVRPE